MTFQQYLYLVTQLKRQQPRLRMGQAYHNTLVGAKRKMADFILNTELDCFYNDANIPEFLSFVCAHWDKY